MDHTLQVDVTWLQPLVGLIIPILTGVLVKTKASSQIKSLVTLFLGALSGAITTVIANQGSLQPKEFAVGIMLTWITAWSSYNGFYKGSGITKAVQTKTADFGVGKPIEGELYKPDPRLEEEARLIASTPKGGR